MHRLRLNILFLLLVTLPLTNLWGQVHSNDPIISPGRPTLPLYDRLDKLTTPAHKTDSLFNWLVGTWSVNAKGYAKKGFRGKKTFEWAEPVREIFFDSNYIFYTSFKDSLITIFTTKGKEKVAAIPEVLLQFDKRSNVLVLKGGYDWGSEIANSWTNTTMVFLGTISLEGFKITERQTWTKLSNDEFRISYEEQLKNGAWFVSETNVYKRLQ